MAALGIASRFTPANPLGAHFWLSVAFGRTRTLGGKGRLRFIALFTTLNTPLETLLFHVLRLMPLCLAVQAALLCRFRKRGEQRTVVPDVVLAIGGGDRCVWGASTNEAIPQLLISLVASVLIVNVKPGHSGTEAATRRIGVTALRSCVSCGNQRHGILLNAAFIAIATSDCVTTVRRPASGVPA